MATLQRQRSVTFADSPAEDSEPPPAETNGSDQPSSAPTPRSFHNYWQALRPWSLTSSLMPVLLGAALACRCSGAWPPISWLILALSCLTALSVHAAGNLVNTYFDYAHGIDSVHSWCDDRTLVDKLLTPAEVERFALYFYIVGMTSFVVTVIVCGGHNAFVLTIIFVLGMSGSFFYTGGGLSALKYKALGELLVFTMFGPVTVAFAFFAQCAATFHPSSPGEGEDVGRVLHLLWFPLLYALPLALNTVAILHANNLRDAKSEQRLGIVTVAIRLGPGLSRLLLVVLLLLPFLLFSILVLNCSSAFLLPLFAAWDALSLVRTVVKVKQWDDPAFRPLTYRIARLNLMLGCLYVVAVMLAPQDIFLAGKA